MGTFNCFVIADVLEVVKVVSLLKEHFTGFVFFATWDVEFISKIERVIMGSVVLVIVAFVHHLIRLWVLIMICWCWLKFDGGFSQISYDLNYWS